MIAHDVNPIELVVWLPALCRKMGVPYCIIKGKVRLGYVAVTPNGLYVKSQKVLSHTRLLGVVRLQLTCLLGLIKTRTSPVSLILPSVI